MAEIRLGDRGVAAGLHLDWSAIWGGVFSFIAIWSVFGLLGTAIFASAANLNAIRPLDEMGLGIGIWVIVLTIIAMYGCGVKRRCEGGYVAVEFGELCIREARSAT